MWLRCSAFQRFAAIAICVALTIAVLLLPFHSASAVASPNPNWKHKVFLKFSFDFSNVLQSLVDVAGEDAAALQGDADVQGALDALNSHQDKLDAFLAGVCWIFD